MKVQKKSVIDEVRQEVLPAFCVPQLHKHIPAPPLNLSLMPRNIRKGRIEGGNNTEGVQRAGGSWQ